MTYQGGLSPLRPGNVNADLKLIHPHYISSLHSHTNYALGAVSRLLFTIPAAR